MQGSFFCFTITVGRGWIHVQLKLFALFYIQKRKQLSIEDNFFCFNAWIRSISRLKWQKWNFFCWCFHFTSIHYWINCQTNVLKWIVKWWHSNNNEVVHSSSDWCFHFFFLKSLLKLILISNKCLDFFILNELAKLFFAQPIFHHSFHFYRLFNRNAWISCIL